MVADGAVEEEVNFPSGDELETEGDELGFLKNLDLNVEAMEGEEQSAAPMSSKVDSANLQEDLEQGQQPESRTSSKVAKYAYTDVRFRQYQRGLVSNPLFSGLDPEEKVTPSSMSNRGGETGAEEAGGVQPEGGQVAVGEVSSVSAAQGNAGASDSSLVSVWRETCVDDNSNEGYFSCDEGEGESVVPPQNGSGGGMLRGAIWGPPTQKNAF